jgi:hypothetical protein
LSTLPPEFPLLGTPLWHSHHYDQPYRSLNVYSAERQEYEKRFMYAHKCSTAFNVPIFNELSIDQ